MTRDELETVVLEALTGIAPEIDAGSVRRDLSLRDQFDLDSMDFLNFVVAVHERLGIDIPETDYPKLITVDGAVAYLVSKTAGHTSSPS